MVKRDERGYIVVETIGAFVPFLMLVISILSLVNLVAVQARVHYAITQAAETVSLYSYVLDITGAADIMRGLAGQSADAQKEMVTFKENYESVMDGLKSLSGSQVQAGVSGFADQTERMLNDPKAMIQKFLSFGAVQGEDWLFNQLLRGLTRHYLTNDAMNGDEYLKISHVKDGLAGLDFSHHDLLVSDGSRLMTKDGEIYITVRYEIEYTFGMLPLPFSPTLKVTQHVRTKAWLGGSGEGYKK